MQFSWNIFFMLLAVFVSGSCTDSATPQVCQAKEQMCSGKTPMVCALDGSRWVALAPCGQDEDCKVGICVSAVAPCGDGVCSPGEGETPETCPADCAGLEGCGDGTCDADQESCANCPSDCGQCCGDGSCDAEYGEVEATCPADCTCAWEHDLKFGDETIFGVWADAPTNLFVVSESGCYHKDASGWSGPLFTLPESDGMSLAWTLMGTGKDDLWLGTFHGLYHYDGAELSLITGNDVSVAQLWVNGTDDVWFVEDGGDLEMYRAGHWHGSGVVYLELSSGIKTIQSLWSDGAGGVWIGGGWDDDTPLLLKYDIVDDVFKEQPIALGINTPTIDAIFGFAPDDLLLMGGDGSLWRFEPPSTVAHLADVSGGNFKMWASSPARVVAGTWDRHLHEINTETGQVTSRSDLSIIRTLWGVDAQNIWLGTLVGLVSYSCQ